MKVILIKIYGKEEKTVHVSAVSGTPLGLNDMTVISQVTDHWRRGPAGPHCSHNFHTSSRCHLNIQESSLHQVSPRLCGLLYAIYTSLSLWSVNSPQDKPLWGGKKRTVTDFLCVCVCFFFFLLPLSTGEADSSSHPACTNLNIRHKLTSHSIFLLSSWCLLVLSEKENSSMGP